MQNEQLLDSLRAELQFENERVVKEVKSVPPVVSNVLNADDRALAALNVLISGSADLSVHTGNAGQRLAELTSGLQHFRVQAVKDRLDCTYLRCLDDQPSPPEGEELPHHSPATVTDIQNDLGSLYAEIEDVVTMTVRHDHAGPIETTLHEIDCGREKEENRVAEQVCICVHFSHDFPQSLVVVYLTYIIVLDARLTLGPRMMNLGTRPTLISHRITRAAVVEARNSPHPAYSTTNPPFKN